MDNYKSSAVWKQGSKKKKFRIGKISNRGKERSPQMSISGRSGRKGNRTFTVWSACHLSTLR